MNAVVKSVPEQSKSVLTRMADRFGVDPDKMLATLRATAFRGDATNEQLMALCIVAEQYQLNPWTKEIHAFPGGRGEIIPVVGVDGWSRIINTHPQFDGMDFKEGELNAAKIPEWIECSIHRKDRAHPTTTREYFEEVKRDTGPWRSHPRRMLRHKAVIQCARLAFGFAGIYDPDEAEAVSAAIEVRAQETDKVSDFAKRLMAALDVDMSEEAIANGVACIYAEFNGDPDLELAVWSKLGSKDRRAIKEFLALAQKTPDAEFSTGKLD